jgi:hypothetical protein
MCPARKSELFPKLALCSRWLPSEQKEKSKEGKE